MAVGEPRRLEGGRSAPGTSSSIERAILGGASYELPTFKFEDHLMDGGRGAPEERLHVDLCWGPTIERCVGVDEGEVLALFLGVRGAQGDPHPAEIMIKSSASGGIMNVVYRVDLTAEEGTRLAAVVASKAGAQKRKRAQILLAAAHGIPDATDCPETLPLWALGTIYRTKKRFVTEGLEASLEERPGRGASRKLTKQEEATLVALACSTPPAGRRRWTLELLAGEFVRLVEHDNVLERNYSPPPCRKRPETVAAKDVVRPQGRRRIRGADGGRPRPVHGAARPERRPVVKVSMRPRHNSSGKPESPCPSARPTCTNRLRIPTQRNGQPICFRRCASGVATRQGDQSPDQHRLRRVQARPRRLPLPRRRTHSSRARQSQYSSSEESVRSVPARRSSTNSAPTRVPLHATACELAQHGRDRDLCPRLAVSRPAHPRPHDPRRRGRCLATTTKCARRATASSGCSPQPTRGKKARKNSIRMPALAVPPPEPVDSPVSRY